MAQAVRDIMTTDVKSCQAGDTLQDAARAMRDADIGDVIVLDDEQQICGILTDRDIAIRAVAEGRDPATMRVDDVCTPDPLTIGPDEDLMTAVQLMRDRAIRRLPVVQDGRAVGVISLGDLAVERDPSSALADISQAPADS